MSMRVSLGTLAAVSATSATAMMARERPVLRPVSARKISGPPAPRRGDEPGLHLPLPRLLSTAGLVLRLASLSLMMAGFASSCRGCLCRFSPNPGRRPSKWASSPRLFEDPPSAASPPPPNRPAPASTPQSSTTDAHAPSHCCSRAAVAAPRPPCDSNMANSSSRSDKKPSRPRATARSARATARPMPPPSMSSSLSRPLGLHCPALSNVGVRKPT
mmetsp:Transcript_21280/g.53401  ORF Transcript_21280/g.53401 Transcript_21280/m.53401 type:complete len:216 (+) Transcript_21280:483-1130(+)